MAADTTRSLPLLGQVFSVGQVLQRGMTVLDSLLSMTCIPPCTYSLLPNMLYRKTCVRKHKQDQSTLPVEYSSDPTSYSSVIGRSDSHNNDCQVWAVSATASLLLRL